MSPPRPKWIRKSWLVLSVCTICVAVIIAGWLLKDATGKIIIGWAIKNAPAEAPGVENPPQVTVTPPAPKLSPTQVEFWDYLEQFNRLPDNPTEEMVAVYNTKGIAPEFHALKSSDTSVLGDLKGLSSHRELFPKRYPWVQPLLERYEIEVPISTERFSESAEEIGEKYNNLLLVRRQYKKGSSAKCVGEFWLGKISKRVKQRDFQ